MTHDTAEPGAPVSDGFSLIEVMVAMSILMVGLLGLAQVFYVGMASPRRPRRTSSRARRRARRSRACTPPATPARITWAQIRNVDAPTCATVPADPPLPAVALYRRRRRHLPQRRAAAPAGRRSTAWSTRPTTPRPAPRSCPVATAASRPVPRDHPHGGRRRHRLIDFWREITICDVNRRPAADRGDGALPRSAPHAAHATR